MTRTIWIDVEDLFGYERGNARPSGIQRLSFQIYHALQHRAGRDLSVRFVRHAKAIKSFRPVPWSEVAGLFDKLTLADPPAAAAVAEGRPRPTHAGRRLARQTLGWLPPAVRAGLSDVALSGLQFAQAQRRLTSIVVSGVGRRLVRASTDTDGMVEGATADPFGAAVAPGDILLGLGSPWHPGYAAMIERHRSRFGLRFALLVYDLIPLRRPEYCDPPIIGAFGEFFADVLPLCDHVFAISRATAADVEAYARETGIALPGRVRPIPIGTELRGTSLGGDGVPEARPPNLPPPGSYALVVSTIEARKNHLLLFRVWRRLLEVLPRDEVPTLVFAGRIGWLVEDLRRQIANTGNLGGKLVIVEQPADPVVRALYAGCLFTIFPSFCEGWGLPVSESLAFGKPCLVANTPALLESGGGLVRAFDPDNLHDALAVIRDTIEDRAGLLRWEQQVRREFQHVTWSETVSALLDGLSPTVADRAIALVAE